MLNPLESVNKYCKRGKQLKILQSAAGYYVGTCDEDGPYCRLTAYARTKDDPILSIERECDENQYCNGGSLNGCCISMSTTIKRAVNTLEVE